MDNRTIDYLGEREVTWMNTASKTENIETLINKILPNSHIDTNYIYGYSQPGLLESLKYGKFAFLAASNYFIVYFTPTSLVLLSVTTLGDLNGEYANIPIEDIEYFKAKKGLIQYTLDLKIKGEKKSLKIKCNKFIINMPWQKENLNYIIENNWYGFTE